MGLLIWALKVTSLVATTGAESAVYDCLISSRFPDNGAEYCNERVCLCACVFVCLSMSISPELSVFTKFLHIYSLIHYRHFSLTVSYVGY